MGCESRHTLRGAPYETAVEVVKGGRNAAGGRRTRRGTWRTAIATTFCITSTRIDIFKLILPLTPRFPSASCRVSNPPIFAGKYLKRNEHHIRLSAVYPSPRVPRNEAGIERRLRITIDENLHFIAKGDHRRSYVRPEFFEALMPTICFLLSRTSSSPRFHRGEKAPR